MESIMLKGMVLLDICKGARRRRVLTKESGCLSMSSDIRHSGSRRTAEAAEQGQRHPAPARALGATMLNLDIS